MSADTAPRWRTGRSVGRTLYRDDCDVAYFADREVAAEVAAMLNGEMRDGAFAGYRRELPTAEHVAAHEAAGGYWMKRCGGGPPDFVCLSINEQKSGRIWEHDNGREGPAYGGGYEFRPCLEDGTPVRWPL